MRELAKAQLAELTEAELELVSGGAGTNPGGPPPGSHGATLIGGRPPTLIITPNGQAIEPGTGPVVLRPRP